MLSKNMDPLSGQTFPKIVREDHLDMDLLSLKGKRMQLMQSKIWMELPSMEGKSL